MDIFQLIAPETLDDVAGHRAVPDASVDDVAVAKESQQLCGFVLIWDEGSVVCAKHSSVNVHIKQQTGRRIKGAKRNDFPVL